MYPEIAIQDDTSLKQADTLSATGVDVIRLTEAVDLSVVCVVVRGQRMTFDQLQQVGDVQQKEEAQRSVEVNNYGSLFLRYSMSKNVVTLKLGSEFTQGH